MDGGWFEWDEANEGHVLEHGVEPYEVEEAALDPNRLKDDARNIAGERREALIGMTGASRILHIVYTRRGGKVRPITARAAERAEMKRYRKGKR